MRYWAALDGLRGLAILAVVLFHANVPQTRGGFLGVDVFFVLSGFLITAQLLAEIRRTGKISLKQFYLRRAVRLQPALCLMLATYTMAWLSGLIPGTGANLVSDVMLVFFAWTHWARAFEWHAPDYLGHTWSLGIEEQFYLLWPILISIFGRNALKPLKVALLAGFLALLGMLWMHWLHAHGANSNRLYNGLDTRAMALLCGCAFAGWVHSTNVSLLEPVRDIGSKLRAPVGYDVMGLIALMGILCLMVYADWRHPIMFSWGYMGVALLAMSLIASVVYAPNNPLAVAFSWHPLVFLGKVSYGLYLWHYPLFRIATEQAKVRGYPLEMCMLSAALLACVAAWASYQWLERPLRAYIFERT